ncbi:hypothetical protein BDV93DRAFT_527243 [Ceratobasidium sp. AG-I]|nr:hypothetical protein BDV93DRAFT_527243 [Ceratobasidium sp. AG-I]
MSNPFALWDVARRALDDAIQQYLDSSIALAAAVSWPSGSFSDQNAFEAAVNTIRSDILSLKMRHERLDSAQSSLCRIQNKSSTLIPFNKLPLEIMARIFHMSAGRSCVCDSVSQTLHPVEHYGPKTLLAITHVCAYWRDIAISDSSLWSHVTFHINRDDDFTDKPNCPQTWLIRARSMPLYIHLDGEPRHKRGSRIPGLVATRLLPYLSRITGFRITAGWTYTMTRWFLLKLLVNGGAGSMQEFIHLGGLDLEDNQELPLPSSSRLSRSPESPLPSLRTLGMTSMCFAWDSAIFRNLVDLSLNRLAEDCQPTLQQFLGVLSACPDLRLLNLCMIRFRVPSGSHLTPVTLGALELLDLSGTDHDIASSLLPWISTGESELSLKVNCLWPDASHAIEAVVTFSKRSRVTRLFLIQPNQFTTRYLAPLHSLRVLILDFISGQSGKCPDAIMHLVDLDESQRSARCPKLQSLYLLNCSIDITVKATLEAHSLKRLTFGACKLAPSDEELLHSLRPIVEDVVCVKKLNPDLSKNWYLYMS